MRQHTPIAEQRRLVTVTPGVYGPALPFSVRRGGTRNTSAGMSSSSSTSIAGSGTFGSRRTRAPPGWRSEVLVPPIDSRVRERQGTAPSNNFGAALSNTSMLSGTRHPLDAVCVPADGALGWAAPGSAPTTQGTHTLSSSNDR